jgi:hypothetical protein
VNDHGLRLKLAQRAWLGAMPSEAEVALGARRIELRLGARPTERRIHRGWLLVVLGVLLGGTALAYVASRGAHRRPPTETGQAATPSTGATVQSLPRSVSSDQAEPPAVPQERQTLPPRARPVLRTTRPAPSADTTSWKEVDEALSARDSARAEAALERLGQSPDVAVRAKAELGRAQLAAARGDCSAAARIVAKLAETPDVPEQFLTRGRELVGRCR